MLKAKMTRQDGKPALLFGITEENVKRLKAGQPIKIDLAEMGLEGDILLFYAKDEDGLIRAVAPYIGKDTIVHDTSGH